MTEQFITGVSRSFTRINSNRGDGCSSVDSVTAVKKIPIIGYTRIWHTGTSISLDRQIIFRSIAYSVYSTPYAKEIFKWGIGNPL